MIAVNFPASERHILIELVTVVVILR